MKLRDIMTNQVVKIHPEETVEVAARMLERNNIGSVPVCSGEGKLCGILTDRDGCVVDSALRKAVRELMEEIGKQEISCAVLQSRSPTCGVNQIYDGSFSRKRISGSGVFAQALKDAGIKVIDVEDL